MFEHVYFYAKQKLVRVCLASKAFFHERRPKLQIVKLEKTTPSGENKGYIQRTQFTTCQRHSLYLQQKKGWKLLSLATYFPLADVGGKTFIYLYPPGRFLRGACSRDKEHILSDIFD